MKFKIYTGIEPFDGSILWEGVWYSGKDWQNLEPQTHWNNVFMVEYDDTVDPVVSYRQFDPEKIGPDEDCIVSLNPIQEEYFKAFATEQGELSKAEVEREELEHLEKIEREYFEPYLEWGEYPRKRRDHLLHDSDPYVTLPHFVEGDTYDAWNSWRQWLRDLPSIFATPLDIDTWREPPRDASSVVLSDYKGFKEKVEECIKMNARWNSPA